MCDFCPPTCDLAAQFRELTYAGQLMYVQLVQDGYSPATAISDARYSHGTKKG